MKNNLFLLFAALVIFSLVIFAATLVYLSKSSEYSRASNESTSLPPASTIRPSPPQPSDQ